MTIQLANPKGLPVYFLVKRLKDGQRAINFASTTPVAVGDTVLIADQRFVVALVAVERPCVLDYGQTEPLTFQQVICYC